MKRPFLRIPFIASLILLGRGTLPASPVSNLLFTLVSSDTLSLQWDLQPETSYQIVLATAPGFSVTLASGATPANQNTTSYLNLAPNTSHVFLVKVSSDDDANYLSTATFTPPRAPGPFAALTQAGVGLSSITFSWTPNGNPLEPPTSYQVQVATSADFAGAVSSSDTFTLSAATTTLLPNATYYARVRAMGRTGADSAFNSWIATATLARAPALAGFAMAKTSVSVTVNGGDDPAGTLYRLALSTDGFAGVAFSSQGAATALAVTGLALNNTYQISLEALNFNQLASSRSVVADTSTLADVPGAFLALAAANVHASSITVSWLAGANPLTPPTSYQVQVATSADFAGAVSSSDTYVLSATTDTLTGNSSCYFRIRAFSRRGEPTDYNSTLTTATLAAAPQNPASPAQSVSSIQLSWQSPNPGYTRIEISSSTDDFQSAVATPVPLAANFTDTTTTFLNLRESTSYFFRLRAYNQNNLPGDFSLVVNTRTATTIPEGISNLAADTAFATQDGEIRWQWRAPGGDEQTPAVNVAAYRVRYATFDVTAANFDSPLVSTYTQTWTPGSQGNTDQQIVTGLNPGTTYFFAIKGVDAAGNLGLWSTSGANANRSYFARDLPLAAPANPGFGEITSTSVVLSWSAPAPPTDVDDRDAYRVYWATYSFASTTNPLVFQTTGAQHPALQVTVTGLANETTYYFRVTAVDKGDLGSGLYSLALESALSAATFTLTADRISPAAVSDLTALTGPSEGSVCLQWSAPGDDGTNKSLVGGSLFEIKYSSVGIINAANYNSPPPSFTLSLPTQAVQGAPQSTLIAGLLTDATYWFAIKTRDDAGNYSVWNSSADVPTVNTVASTRSRRDDVAPQTVSGLSLTQGYHKMTLAWVSPGDNGLAGNLTGQFMIKYGSAPITTLSEFFAAQSTAAVTTAAAQVSSWAQGTAVSTVIAGLANNVTYYFALIAQDDAGNWSAFSAAESSSSYPRNQQPAAFALASPADLFVASSTALGLQWNAATDADTANGDALTYIVQYSTDPAFPFPATSSAPAGVALSTGVSASLIENSTSYWRVRVQDSDGAVSYSNNNRLRINYVNTQPSTFSLLVPALSSTAMTLTPTFDWQDSTDPDPGDVLTYTLKYSLNADAEGGTAVAGLSTSAYTVAAALTENVTYYWKVLALSTNPFTGTDTVQSGATFYFKTNSVAEPPNAFSQIRPAADDRSLTQTPTFLWQEATDNDPGDTLSYSLTILNAGTLAVSTQIVDLTVTTHTLTQALADNTSYYWRLTAKSTPDGLTRDTGQRLLAVDTAKELPAAVTLASPAHQSLVNTSSPTLSWNGTADPDPQDKVRYLIKIGEKSDYSDALGQQVFASDNNGFGNQRQFSLKDQTTYFWQVAAAGYQAIGSGGSYVHVDTGALAGCASIVGGAADECYSVSAQRSFIVSLINTAPSAASLLSPADGMVSGSAVVTFDWSDSVETDPAQTIDYTLEISTLSNFSFLSVQSTGIAVSSYTLSAPLLQNRTYYWRILTQDRFADKQPAGSAVASLQSFSFRVPVLTTPKEPTSVKGSLSADADSFTISWNAVGQNTDGSSLTDLAGYRLYRQVSTAGLGTGTPLASISSSAASYTDTGLGGAQYYYTIRAVNTSFLSADTSGTISINSTVVRSAADTSVLVIPDAPDLAGRIEIVVPEDVKSVLEQTSNGYGEDLKFELARSGAAGLQDALFGVEIKIKGAQTNRELSNFTFDKPIRVGFPVGGLFAPRFGAPAPAPVSPAEIVVFWHNGVEWLNLGGTQDVSNNIVYIRTRNVGTFAARQVVRATEFELSAVTPNRIFTPNGDLCNDVVTFQYQNPRGFSNVRGRIFDLHGASIAEMKPTSSLGSLSFNASCPKPNLADDTLIWDGRDSDGNPVPKGIYLYQLEAEGKALNGTIVVAR